MGFDATKKIRDLPYPAEVKVAVAPKISEGTFMNMFMRLVDDSCSYADLAQFQDFLHEKVARQRELSAFRRPAILVAVNAWNGSSNPAEVSNTD